MKPRWGPAFGLVIALRAFPGDPMFVRTSSTVSLGSSRASRGGHVAMNLRALIGVPGRDQHGPSAEDAVVGILHEQLDAQALGVGVVTLRLEGDVGDG